MNKKKHRRLSMKGIILLSVLLLAVASIGIWFVMRNNHPVTLLADRMTLEYGATKDNVTIDQFMDETQQTRVSNLLLDTSSLGNGVPEPGTYTTVLSYNWRGKQVAQPLTIQIVDTVAPVFTSVPERIEVAYGDLLMDPDHYLAVDERSAVDLKWTGTMPDTTVPGTYELGVIATDASGNSVTDALQLVVLAKPDDVVETTVEATWIQGILLVNKQHGLPADYDPGEDPTAGTQIRKLITDMQAEGFDIANTTSGYRSYTYQQQVYGSIVQAYGQAEADKVSARPGYSEHQTGLTFDLKHQDGNLVDREPEASWIALNAHKYGFIVRYPEDKTTITGYSYEPWHLRYVGVAVASSIYEQGICLEEYLGVDGGTQYR